MFSKSNRSIYKRHLKLVSLALALFFGVWFYNRASTIIPLRERGITIMGEIIAERELGNGFLWYKFKVGNSEYKGAEARLKTDALDKPSAFRRLLPGQPVEIVYLPENPHVNKLKLLSNYWCLLPYAFSFLFTTLGSIFLFTENWWMHRSAGRKVTREFFKPKNPTTRE
jgi:hypothetical protein